MRVRVPLPNENPDSWTVENCREALEAIAEGWKEARFDVLAPGLIGIRLTRDHFFAWVDRSDFPHPTFWGTRLGTTSEPALVPIKTGTAGAPTSLHLIRPEAERRLAAGDFPKHLTDFTKELVDWFGTTQWARERAPVPRPRTLENPLRPLWHGRDKSKARKTSP
jgi:hypothetical protein